MRTKLLSVLLIVVSTCAFSHAVPQHDLSVHNPFDFNKVNFVGAGDKFTWAYSCNDGVAIQGLYVVEAGSLESEKVIELAYIREHDDICNLVYAIDPLPENAHGWDLTTDTMKLIMQHVRGISKLTKAPAYVVPHINPKNLDRYLETGTE